MAGVGAHARSRRLLELSRRLLRPRAGARAPRRSRSAAARAASPATWWRAGTASPVSTLPPRCCAPPPTPIPASRYVVGLAEALPFDDGAFDLVVAYNSLMDVADMRGRRARGRARPRARRPAVRVHHASAARRAARGTRRRRRAAVVARPTSSSAGWTSRSSASGLAFTFAGWCYPLEAYTAALEAAGLLIEAIREPADPAGGRWARVPMFLMWRALKAR